jgi:hypothetical protein
MLRRGLYRSLWIALVAAGVLLVPPAAALADSAPPAPVQSNFENTYGASLSRDCGFSAPLPANPAASLWLASPVFSGSHLYLFGSQCSSQDQFGDCTSGSVYLARTGDTASSWDNPANYQWRDGGTWTSAASSATSIIPSATPISAVSVGNFSSVGQGIVLIAQTNVGGHFVAYEPVSSLTGTWQQVISATVPCGSGTTVCHAIIGHPELSTTSELMVSYFDPAQGPAGHVMADAFAW